jgi:hypothetical protein
MTTIAENLKTKILTDTTVKNLAGDRVCFNRVPKSDDRPYIWYAQSGSLHDATTDEAAGMPTRTLFDVECVALSPERADELKNAVQALLNMARGTFGDSTCQGIFAQEARADYQPRGAGSDSGKHVYALSVEVVL